MRQKFRTAYMRFREWRQGRLSKFLWRVETPNAIMEGWIYMGDEHIFVIREDGFRMFRSLDLARVDELESMYLQDVV